jgi:hypothetical protein
MKIAYLFTALLLATAISTSSAQQVAPRTEFIVKVSQNTVEIKPGTTTEISVDILRSKAYTKMNAKLGFSSQLPEGITATFEPAEGVITSSKLKFVASSTAKPGQYQLILNGTLNNKVKGTILKLTVTDSPSNEVVKAN